MTLSGLSRPLTGMTEPIGTREGSAAAMPSVTLVPDAVREPEQYAVAVKVTCLPAGASERDSGEGAAGCGDGWICPAQPAAITSNTAGSKRRKRPRWADRGSRVSEASWQVMSIVL